MPVTDAKARVVLDPLARRTMLGYLRVTEGPDEGQTFELENGATLCIGRSEDSDTQLSDLTVSRIHCHVRVAENQIVLSDDGNNHSGTFVNGQRIREQTLKPGDTITIGGTELTLFVTSLHKADVLRAAQKPNASS
jgi:pSer/pThr/pTyr-binding forkhead associated (FHA) protein